MAAEHAGDLLHGLDPGPQGARAPAVQEPPGPGGGHVGPEELKVFPQEVAADRPQVVAEQLGDVARHEEARKFGPALLSSLTPAAATSAWPRRRVAGSYP